MLRSRMLALGFVVVILGGAYEMAKSGTFCEEFFGVADFHMHGICFSPYRDGEMPPDAVDVNQIRERLEIIAPYTEWIRSFSATAGLEKIPKEAKDLGLKVAMGAWIRHSEVRQEEINNLIAKTVAGYVDVAVVGNEELWWGEHGKSDAIEPNLLVSLLQEVHQRLDANGLSEIPVTIAEPWDALFKRDPNGSFRYQEVLDALDIFYVNVYPWHENAHISKAIEKMHSTYSDILTYANEAGPEKKVVIGETGWPSEGEHWGLAEASLANSARYFYELQCWAARNNVEMFYFSSFDEQWKTEPTPEGLPPEYEGHWGIWDSNDVIKETFLPEHIFCEDFDPCVNAYCSYRAEGGLLPDPNIMIGDANSDGDYLRVLYDGEITALSSATFDRIAEGPFCRTIAEFDFRMFGEDYNGDGFSFLLLPTSRDGAIGCHEYWYGDLLAEEPALPDTFAIGFEICSAWPCGPLDMANRIYISWDEQWYPDGMPIEFPADDVDLDSGDFHRVRIELRCGDGDTGLVSVFITPDVYDVNHLPVVTIAENVVIGDVNHPYKPYENRIEFAGRNGGKSTNVDIDNIYVSYRTKFCDYILAGDANGDCQVDFFDIALLVNNWLVNCNAEPWHEGCVPK